jgi:uncharacterized protein (TIRG00374 family)
VSEHRSIGDRVEQALERHADVEAEIERGERTRPTAKRVRSIALRLALLGVSLYLVFPSLVELASSWRDAAELEPAWLAAMAGLQLLSLASVWGLQFVALHRARIGAVITSQLAGNALAKVAPGGGAVGAALQYRMLVETGLDRGRSVSGLTAANLMTFAVLLALPVLSVPTLLRGTVNRTLLEATFVGLVVFGILFAAGSVLLASDRALAGLGRVIQRVRNRLRRAHAAPLEHLPERLLRERSRVLLALGPRWKRALAATIGRWAFDFATLLAALAAIGSSARPSVVLLAFCAAQLLAQIPITPGGLGFVEAGLTAMLTLAGVGAGAAVLATFVYRLFSYWLPLPLGLGGYAAHRRRLARAG